MLIVAPHTEDDHHPDLADPAEDPRLLERLIRQVSRETEAVLTGSRPQREDGHQALIEHLYADTGRPRALATSDLHTTPARREEPLAAVHTLPTARPQVQEVAA